MLVFGRTSFQDGSEEKQRKLCLKMAELCGGKIRGIHVTGNKYDCGTFVAEVDVGRARIGRRITEGLIKRREAC